MKGTRLTTILLLCAAVLVTACASVPKKVQEDFNAAKSRADKARIIAASVQGQVYFPDEWKEGDTNYDAAKKCDATKKKPAIEATGLYISAAKIFESISEKSSPLFARDMEEANANLQTAKERAEQSRQNATDNNGPAYFPEDWEAVEAAYRQGENASASTKSPAEVQAAADMFTAAADQYDDIAIKGAALLAQEKKEADTALQAAIARADKSRTAAQNVQASAYFADEWQSAESALQSAKDAPRDTTDNVKAAAEQFVAAADAYDELAGKSQPLFARDEAARKAAAEKAAADAKKAADDAKKALDDAQKALTAATQRADKSRQSAVDVEGPTYFANDWKTAESRLQTAKSAKKSTADEMKAATAQFNGAADAYDSIAGKSRPMFTKDKDAATKALQAAVTRAQQSRTAATNAGAQTGYPAEWKAAETKNQSATSAKRGTTAEMNAAVTLYNGAADAYDDIVKKGAASKDTTTDAVAKAKAKLEKSTAFATTTAQEMEAKNE